MERTQEEKLLAGFAHVAVLVNYMFLGLIFNIVIFLIYRPKSQYVASHAKQALGLTIINVIAGYVIAGIFGASVMGMGMGMRSLGGLLGGVFLGGLLAFAWFIAVLVLVIMAAIKGFGGQEYRYPWFGDFVAKLGE